MPCDLYLLCIGRWLRARHCEEYLRCIRPSHVSLTMSFESAFCLMKRGKELNRFRCPQIIILGATISSTSTCQSDARTASLATLVIRAWLLAA